MNQDTTPDLENSEIQTSPPVVPAQVAPQPTVSVASKLIDNRQK